MVSKLEIVSDFKHIVRVVGNRTGVEAGATHGHVNGRALTGWWATGEPRDSPDPHCDSDLLHVIETLCPIMVVNWQGSVQAGHGCQEGNKGTIEV